MSRDEAAVRAGRPRDAGIDDRVLAAAWSILTEAGYQALSFDAIRARAGVSRPALKLRWPSKAALAVDALVAHIPTVLAPDTGSLRDDLAAALEGVDRIWSQQGAATTFPALMADLHNDRESAGKFRDLMLLRGASLDLILERARRRGELRRHIDLNLVADLLEGPILHRHLLSDRATDDELLQATLDGVLNHIAAEPSKRRLRRDSR